MDKKRNIIGTGVPRNRSLEFVGSGTRSGRLLTYNSKKKAESGFKVSGFYTHDLESYIKDTYPECLTKSQYNGELYPGHGDWQKFLEAVEVEIIIKESK